MSSTGRYVPSNMPRSIEWPRGIKAAAVVLALLAIGDVIGGFVLYAHSGRTVSDGFTTTQVGKEVVWPVAGVVWGVLMLAAAGALWSAHDFLERITRNLERGVETPAEASAAAKPVEADKVPRSGLAAEAEAPRTREDKLAPADEALKNLELRGELHRLW
jgi:hypothetical protein